MADTRDLDSLMRALYEVISGPAGAPRDWDRFRGIFHADARLFIIAGGGFEEPHQLVSMTPEDYVKRNAPYFEKNGFFEVEVRRRVERYGHMVQCMSVYEARAAEDDAEPMMSGVNALTLMQGGDGEWRVMTLCWEDVRSGGPLPD